MEEVSFLAGRDCAAYTNYIRAEGFASPTVMRWPFEKIIFFNRKALLYRVNEEFYQIPREVQERSIPVHGNSLEWILNEKTKEESEGDGGNIQ